MLLRYVERKSLQNVKIYLGILHIIIFIKKSGHSDEKGVHGNIYEVERAVGLYPAGGASDDFAKAKAYIPYAVTLELPPDSRSRSGFRISPEKIRYGFKCQYLNFLVSIILSKNFSIIL